MIDWQGNVENLKLLLSAVRQAKNSRIQNRDHEYGRLNERLALANRASGGPGWTDTVVYEVVSVAVAYDRARTEAGKWLSLETELFDALNILGELTGYDTEERDR